MKKYTFITLMILTFPLISTSQSIFLEKGTNAGSMRLGVGIMEDEAFYNIKGSYSLNGRLDLSLAYEKSDFDVDADFNKIRFGADYLILKQGSRLPLNWSLGGSYSLGSLSNE